MRNSSYSDKDNTYTEDIEINGQRYYKKVYSRQEADKLKKKMDKLALKYRNAKILGLL